MIVKAGPASKWGSELVLGMGTRCGQQGPRGIPRPLQPGGRPWASDSSWSCCEPSLSRGLFIPGAAPPASASSLPPGSWGGRRPLGTATGLGGRGAKGGSCS